MHRIFSSMISWAWPDPDDYVPRAFYRSRIATVLTFIYLFILATVSSSAVPPTTGVPAPQVPQLRTFTEKASINRLPIELLSQILVLWAAVDNEGPWMAASISKHWRNVVLSSPTAWGNLSLMLKNEEIKDTAWCGEEEDDRPPRGKRRPFELWLQRSKGTKLSLAITAHNNYPLLEIELVNYCTMIAEHAHRLRFLTIDVELLAVAETVLSSVSKMSLESLRIRVDQRRLPRRFNDSEMFIPWDRNLLRTSGHNANVMIFDGCFPSLSQSQVTTATTLEIRAAGIWGTHLLDLARSAPQLTTLKIRRMQASHPDSQSPGIPPNLIVLPALQYLSLQDVTMDFCADFFSCFDAPALQRLEIENGGLRELRDMSRDGMTFSDITSGFGTAFIQFTKRATGLRFLWLAKSGLHDRHFIEALRHTGALHEIRADCLLIGAPIMRALTPPIASMDKRQGKGKPLLCPNLQRLEITRCDLMRGEHLVALIRARNHRCSRTSPITYLTVKGCKEVSEVHAEELHSVDPDDLQLRVELCSKWMD